ncbi:Ig-like domain-containing protein [Tenacibaculum jejuense]|uniref:Uncharacterized protein n=1 Tax=Tenacibaculum jejuense TaxID=584609 RepID=A0A238U751_9FLAO|nr:Ig-like domain-containing protein [Tenacibaculum jejuense]SNR15013.1 protein of unknown function [Tenacibaculum jejuense]
MIIYFSKVIPILFCKLKDFKIKVYNKANKVFFDENFYGDNNQSQLNALFHQKKRFENREKDFLIFLLLVFSFVFSYADDNTINYKKNPNKSKVNNTKKVFHGGHYYVHENKKVFLNKKRDNIFTNPLSLFALPTIDLNGFTAGNDNDITVQPTTGNVFPVVNAPVVTSDAGIVSATISFTGILDTPDQELLAINNNAPGFDLYFFNTPYDTFTYTVGTTTVLVTQLTDTTFSVTRQFGGAIPNADFEDFLELLFYGDLVDPFTEGIRTMSITITDTNTDTASAQTTIRAFDDIVAVNDTNSVAANNTGTISGNVLTNETTPRNGTLSVTEVDVYPAAVGNSYTTLFGSITINSDGSYTYDVDETNPAVTGLRNGESIDDIISYTVERSVPDNDLDYAYITITINGVDELPNAVDNTDSMTAFVDPNATGNVITDPGPGGAVDAIDRGLNTLVWENEFTDQPVFLDVSGPVNGQSRTIGTAPNDVTLNFTTSDPDNVGIPDRNFVVYRGNPNGLNGGHEGYFRYSIDPSTSPTADVSLTIDFTKPVFNLGFLVVDIDYSQGTTWQDQINIQGSLSGTSVPFNFITTGGVVNPSTGTFYGTGNAVPEDATGNVNIFFDQPIDQLVLNYNYGPDATDFDKGLQIAGVSDIFWQGEASIEVTQVDGNAGNLGVSYAGTYGSIVMNSDGGYTYTLDNTNPAVQNLLTGQSLTEVFNYTLFDGFNTDDANLTITINGSGTDSDLDGISDLADLDDDNDGILDTEEFDCPSGTFVPLGQTFTQASTGTTTGGNASGTVNNVYSENGVTGTFSFEVLNNAVWSSGVRSQGPTAGVDGNYINVQPRNTNFPAGTSYPADAATIDVAVYTFTFDNPIHVSEFKWGGIDNSDRVDFSATLGGVNVPIEITNVNIPGANFSQPDGPQSVLSTSPGANAPNNVVSVNSLGAVDTFVIVAGKRNGDLSNVTMQFTEFSYCFARDTDMDGTPDYLDLDSDNDGCNDVVESGGTDDNNDGRLNGHPTVDAAGTATSGQVTNGSTVGGYDGANGTEIVSDNFSVSVTPTSGEACEGSDIVFTATATGTRVTDFGASGATTDDTTIPIPAGDYTYRWFLGASTTPLTDGAPYSGTNTSMLTITATSALAGNAYRVEVTTTGNSCPQEDTGTLTTVNPNPVATVNDPEVCMGTTSSSLTVTATTGTPTNYTIDYDAAAEAVGFTDVSSATSLSGATFVIPGGAAANTYNGVITYIDANGCSGTDAFTIEINENPVATVNDPEVCMGTTSSSLTVTATTGTPINYTIDYDAAAEGAGFTDVTSASSLTGATFVIPAAAPEAIYNGIITYIDANGCSGTDAFTVTVNANPVAVVNDPEVCMGRTSAELLLSTRSGLDPVTYTIDYDAAAEGAGFTDVTSATSLTGATFIIPAAASTGAATYNGVISFTDANGCEGTDSFVITINGDDADSDGISDICDLDDDNDGILDTNESFCRIVNSSRKLMVLYDNTGGLQTPTTVDGDFFTPNALSNQLFGSGVNYSNDANNTSGGYVDLQGVDQADLAGAKADNDYVEYNFITGDEGYRIVQLFFFGEPVGIPAVDYRTGYSYQVEISDDNFATSTVLFDEATVAASTFRVPATNNVDLQPITKYTIRIFLYNNPPANAGSITIDNVAFQSVLCDPLDTDMDGTPDYLDIDSDNDGCNDVVESGGTDDNDDGRLNGHPTVGALGSPTSGQVTNGSSVGGYDGVNGTETASDTFSVSASPTSGEACEGSDIVFTATATGVRVTDFGTTGATTDDTTVPIPAGDYTYRWFLGASTTPLTDGAPYSGTNTSMLTVTATSALAGNMYRVEVTTTGNSCPEVDTVTLTTVNPNPVATVNDPEVCMGTTSSSLTVTATTGTPINYTIDYDAAAEAAGFVDVSSATSLSGATYVIPGGASANTYNGVITYIDSNGCSGTDAFTVTINANPVATVNDPEVCMGTTSSSLTVIATTGTPINYTIDYDAAAEAAGFVDVSSATSLSGATYVIPGGASANTYNGVITYIDSNGCSGTDAFTVTINANPVATVNDAEVCSGDTSSALTVTATTGTPINYTIDYDAAAEAAGFVDVSSATSLSGATYVIPGGASANTYNGVITYIDSNGCSGTDAFTVTINANPVATVNDPEVCMGTTSSSLTVTATSGSPVNYTIDYDAAAEAAGFVDVSSATSLTGATYVIPGGASANTYNGVITYIDSNGCSGTDAFTVTINANPVATVNDPEVCMGTTSSSLTVTATSGSPVNYTIDYDAAAEAAGFVDVSSATSLTGATYVIPGGASANTYNGVITYIDSNGCSGTDAFTVTINANPVATVNDPEVCMGTTSSSLTVTATSGSPVNYTIDYDAAAEAVGFVDVSSATSLSGATYVIPGGASANTYNGVITYIDSNGCSGTDAFTVTINANPVATVNDAEVCSGDTSSALTVTATSGSPVNYTIDYDAAAEAAGFVDVSSATSLTGATYVIPGGASANTYNGVITYIDSNGCSGTDAFTVTINANPVATVNDAEVCSGDTSSALTVTATSGSPVNYTIDYDAAAEAVGFVDVSSATSLSGATYVIPGGAAANTYNGVITYIDSNGCSGTDTFTVTINANPVATVNDAEVCSGDTSSALTVTATSGSPVDYTIDYDVAAEAAGFVDVSSATSLTGATYVIPGGASVNTYNGVITYIDSNGCSGTDTFTVTINANPVATVNDVTVVPGTTSSALTVTATSGSPVDYTIDYDAAAEAAGFVDVSSATSLTGATYVIPGGASANTYNGVITYIDSNGCSGTDTFTITIDQLPIASNDSGVYTPGSPSMALNVTSNDTTGDTVDPSTVVFTTTGLPAGSSVSLDGKTLTVPGEGTWNVDGSGNVIFTPDGSFTGDPTPASYTVEDAEGNVSNEATITLDADPIASNDSGVYTPGSPSMALNVTSNDTTGDTVDPSTVVFTTTGLPAGSSVSPDGKTLTVPGEGTWNVDGSGNVIFTPDGSFTGDPTPASYTVEDTEGNVSNEATITLDADPIASNDSGVYTPGSPSMALNVTSNDTTGDTVDPSTVVFTTTGLPAGSSVSPDGKTLTVPGEGTWNVDGSGNVIFTPDGSFTGDPTPASYTVEDTEGNVSNEATITLDADPIASNDSGVYTPGSPSMALNVTSNDTTGDTVDPSTVVFTTTGLPAGSSVSLDGKTLTVPGEGTWNVDGSGNVIFTPDGSFTGDPTPASYTVEDAEGNVSNEATITLDADPIASNDSGVYTPGSPSMVLNVTSNDTTGDTVDPSTVVFTTTGLPAGSSVSPDGKTLTVPGEGTWSVDGSGNVIFTPDGSFTGDPTPASYTVEDAEGNVSNEATITLDADPIASNDSGVYTPGSPSMALNVTSNDTTGDTVDPSTVVFTTTGLPAGSSVSPDGKTLTVPGEGTWNVDGSGNVIFTPDGSFTGDPTPASYTVEDAEGNVSNEATITLDADPIASNDSGVYTPGSPSMALNVTSNDTTGDTVDPSTVVFTTTGLPAGSSVSPDGKTLTVPGEGTWNVDGSGNVIFTPDGSFTGDPTPASYTVEDAEGNVSNEATITLDADPIASNDSGVYTPGSPSMALNVTSNDTTGDTVDPSTVVFTTTGLPAGSSVSPDGKTLTVPGEGTWNVDGSGNVIFTPDGSFTGDPTPASYTVEDAEGNVSNEATITLDADPIASNDSGVYTPGSPSMALNVTSNDTTGDTVDPSTVVFTTTGLPAGSSVSPDGKTLTVPGEGTWNVDGSGNVIFTPDGSFTGDPTPASYTVEDTEGNVSNEATITLDADPIASNDSGVYTPGSPSMALNVTSNDTTGDTVDPSTVVFTTTGLPAGSSVSPDGKTLTVPGEGTWNVDGSGNVIFTPDGSFTGDPTPASYTVEDAEGNVSNEATITLDADPIASNDSGVYTPGSPSMVLNVTSNDTTGDTVDPSTVVFTTTGLPAGSSVSPDGKTLTVPGEGTWSVDGSGNVIFTPDGSFTGDPTPASYTVEDAEGNVSNEATITLDADPIASNDSGVYTPGSPSMALNVTSNDTTGDTVDPSTVVFTTTGLPAGSSVSPDGKTLTVPGEGTWNVDGSGNVIFTPDGSFTGDPTPASYTVEDAEGNVSNEATITLDADPIATDDTGDYTPGSPSDPIDVAGNDTTGDTVDPSTVSLDTTGLPAGSSCTATDAEGDCIEVTVPGEGVWTVDPSTGEVIFTPETGYMGDPTPIAYDIEDAEGNSDSGTITVVADPLPVATDDTGDYTPGSPSDPINVAGNDTSGDTVDPSTVSLDTIGLPAGSSCTTTDAEGDCIEVTVPGEGVWSVDPSTGEVVFTPDPGFMGDPTSITYDIEDAEGNSDSGIITVVADPLPVATDDTGDYTPGSPSDPINVAGNDISGDTVDPSTVSLDITGLPAGSSCTATDAEGDCIEVTVPGEGVWSVDPSTGEVVFTPDLSFTGDPTPITYDIEDAEGNSDSGTITVVADPLPIATNDTGVYTPGTTSNPINVTNNDTTGDTVDPSTVVFTTTGLPAGSSVSPDGKTLTVPGEGVWTVDSSGNVIFTPDGSFTGTPTVVSYTVEDAEGNISNEATITLSSDPLPVATDDTGDYTPGSPSDPIDVAGNDISGDTVDPSTVSLDITGLPAGSSCTATDAEGDCIEVTVPGEGVWSVDPSTGEVVFTPETGYMGDPTPITYDIEDAEGNSDSGTITVVADPLPVATDDTGGYTPGSPSDPINVAGNDTSGDPVDPSTVSLDTTGLPAGSSCTATDAEGDCIEVTVPGEGVWSVDPSTGEVVFTPDLSFMGDPTPITYDIEDAEGNSDSGTITVVADPLPIATNDTGVYTPGTTSNLINVTNNDTTGDTVDPSTVVFTTTGLPAGSSVSPDGKTLTVPGEGVWTVDSSGNVIFTPDGSFTGTPTVVSYTVEDAEGNISNEATITLSSDPLPVATDDTGDYTPGSPSDPIDVAGNDISGDTVDPSTVSLDITGLPAGSSCTATDAEGDCIEVTVPGEGVWSVDPSTGEVVFTPETGYMGDPTPITYDIEDAEGNSDSGTITVVADPLPVATDDTGDYTPGSPSDPINVAGNDTSGDPVDPSTVSLDTTGLPAGSSCTATDVEGDCIEVTVPGEGVWSVDPSTGEVVFTPDLSFTGDPTPITYDIEDAEGNSDSGTITVVADPLPIATNDTGVYTPGTTSNPINVTNNDTTGDTVDPSTVVFTTTGLPAGSSVSPDGKTLTVPGEGVWTVDSSGNVIFTPDGSFTGTPTVVSYTVEDAEGNISNEATITLSSDPLPVATDDTGDYTPGSPSDPIDVAGNDISGDTVDPSTVSLDITGLPAGSSCTATDAEGDCIEVTVPGEGVWSVDPSTGEVVFTPETGYMGDPTPITYDIEDAEGNSDSGTITVVADPLPVATDDTGDYTPGSPSDPINVAGNDTSGDPVDPSTVSLDTTGLPAGSSCTATDAEGDCIEVTVPGEGVWSVDPSTGEVVFTPDPGFMGDPTPITYNIEDAEGNSDSATITIINSDFILNDDSDVTEFDTPIEVDITNNDTNVPSTGDTTITSDPSNGTVTIDDGGTPDDPSDDTIIYTPNPGFTGTDTFVYQICDDDVPPNCKTATVTITVNGPENDVFNLVSDDGNNTNGVFFIAGIENFPNNTVEIFNRWGNTVYKASGYNNETVAFRGVSNGRVTISVDSKLPVGTYYYVIDYGDENKKPKAGWLYINR